MTKEELEKEAKTECFMLTVNTIGIDQRDVELAYVMGAEPREKQIADLEKENAELKEKLNKRSCQNCKHNNKSCPSDGSCKKYSKWEGYENPQLTKAKEIIKKFSEFVNNDVEYAPEHPQEHTDLWNKLCKEAEQFLKDSEVEK